MSAPDLTRYDTATLHEATIVVLRRQRANDQPDVFSDGGSLVMRGIMPAWSGARVAGRAFTVQGAGGDNLALHRAVYAAPSGSVLVADVNGAEFGHWGEILTIAGQSRGLAGLIIDGGVRDLDRLEEALFPVFSRHNSVRGTRKFFAGAFEVPIRVGGASIRNGDLVVGDSDGVVVVPTLLVEAVLLEAEARARKESEFMHRLRRGATTLELFGLDR